MVIDLKMVLYPTKLSVDANTVIALTLDHNAFLTKTHRAFRAIL